MVGNDIFLLRVDALKKNKKTLYQKIDGSNTKLSFFFLYRVYMGIVLPPLRKKKMCLLEVQRCQLFHW